ncbi:hypothetical protein HispidOSU_003815 [Sigmodon hispidus]
MRAGSVSRPVATRTRLRRGDSTSGAGLAPGARRGGERGATAQAGGFGCRRAGWGKPGQSGPESVCQPGIADEGIEAGVQRLAMPQGAGSHAVRGGALRLGAGHGTATGGARELVRVEGGAQRPAEELERIGGGAWRLEEEPEQVGGGALGSETLDVGSQALVAGLQPVSGVALAVEKGPSTSEGGATAQGAETRAPKGGAKEPCEGLIPSNGPGRPRGGGLRGGRAWGRGRPRTPPGEIVWVERARRPADSGPVWVPRRPPRAQSWGGASGGGSTGSAWGMPSEDRGSPEPPSGDVWVPRGRPPAAASEVWVCWTGSSWVWREWGRPVGTNPVQSDRVWTLRKETGGN